MTSCQANRKTAAGKMKNRVDGEGSKIMERLKTDPESRDREVWLDGKREWKGGHLDM